MKRLLSILFLLVPTICLAQKTASNPLGGNLTAQDAGTCSTTGSFLWQQLPSNAATTIVNLAGTFSGTLTIRLSNNGGGSWTTNTTMTSTGNTSISTNGFTDICADVTTFTSGSFGVTITTGLNTGPQGPAGPAGSGGGGTTVTLTCGNPTGAINGANVTFTLPSAPAIPANLLLYHNGVLQIQPTDYSISSATITAVVPPLTGESLNYCYPNNSIAWTANAGTPGGSINGANTTFTLPTAPLTPANLQLYQNGVVQKQGVDYILAGLTITYIAAPASGGNLFYAAYN